MSDLKLTPVFSHKQFFVLAAGACLGVVLCVPAFVLAFPGTPSLLACLYLLSGLLLLVAVASWFSDRPRQLVVRALHPLWARVWPGYLAGAVWLIASFLIIWRYREAFQTGSILAYLALLGFALWATAGLAICLGPALPEAWRRPKRRWAALLSVLVVVGWIAFGFYLWGENLGAQWWIVDDHETLNLVGDGLSPFQVWDRLSHSTVMGQVKPFSGSRFRPVFWIFQALEAALWGDQPLLWYFFRISVFILACAVCYRLLEPLLGTLNSLLLTLVLASFAFWGDIVARLGPAENYALLGLIGYALAYVALVRYYRQDAPGPDRWLYANWILLGASAVIAMGAKENFVWLLLPNVVLLGYLIFKRQFSIVGILVLALSSAFGLLSLATVFLTNTTQGKDEYGNSALLTDRIGQTLGALQRNVFGLPGLLALGGLLVAVGIGALVLYRAGDRAGLARLGRGVLIATLVAGGLAMVYISQLYFYDGDLPTNNRYDMPGSLLLVFMGLTGVLLLLLTLQLVVKHPYYDTLAAILLALVMAGFLVTMGFGAARAASRENVERTRQFSADLAVIKAIAEKNPQSALVLDTHSGYDFEVSYSLARFLRRAHVENPIYLRYTGTEHLDSELVAQKQTAQILYDIFRGARQFNEYESFQKFAGGPCLSIAFSGDSHPPCTPVMRIWR